MNQARVAPHKTDMASAASMTFRKPPAAPMAILFFAWMRSSSESMSLLIEASH